MENTEAQAIATLSKPVDSLGRGDLVAIHEDYKIHDLEQFQNGRDRARGLLKTPSFEDFKSYVLSAEPQHNEDGAITLTGAPVFVDHKNVSATAVLNFAAKGFSQGHCDHKALLQLEPTVVWSKLNALKDRKLSQRDFAVFLEDWVSVLEITDADGNVIGGAQALAAVRNMKIDSTVSSDHSVGNLSESRSRFEQVEARSKEDFTPAYFKIRNSAYFGLDERLIVLRLIVNTNEDKPTFSIQIVKEELLLDEIIQDFKAKVIELLPENPVRIGTFAA
ncbi:hypothetical protein AVENLUH5627_02457 [Acinetobacter venetianus]|uniref:DUF2303 family protein n=1 Tax=Acinetobacter venetianus TaxID=52133 RepID=A0A150HM16_9GAMM|nr:DUF2303 family protein [Acinetobacter venetianus]KXZ66763.1 hypothetical protein AVENLUH5627_02457 [Acinetobacter venetianus]